MLRLYPYFCGCIEDPVVAASLKTLVVRNCTWTDFRGTSERTVSNDEETALREREATHQALLTHVRGLGLSEPSTESVIAALQNRRHTLLDEEPPAKSHGPFATAAAVVLLSLCPNIKTIHIDTLSHEGALGEFLLMNNHNLLPSQHLQHLSSVICCPEESDQHGERQYADVAVPDITRSFHRLPSIRSLSFVGVMLENGSHKTFLAPAAGTFTRLSFEHVDLTTVQIASIIRASSRLEGLSISLGGMYQLLGSSVHINPKTLGKCLHQHRTTLRVLDLDIEAATASEPEEEEDMFKDVNLDDSFEFDRWFHLEETVSVGRPLTFPMYDTRWYGGGIGSLRDFEALTRLTIQPAKLIGGDEAMWGTDLIFAFHGRPRLVDMLPPSLEYLCFYGYKRGKSAWLDEHVDELMMEKAEKLPKLREIVGCGDGEDSDEEDDEDDEDEWDPSDQEHLWEEDDERFWARPRQALGWVEVEADASAMSTLSIR
ncbi:hypothetical protein F5X68DRAFT_131810 [Plectosphaerella plurivora]|uniref:Uncharacterized protein n=1 Tax=Plectosphaerella plurivora TaxID=936078 RepID=A0A9P8VFF6_9PEZI|nr:hypothetical protein F5X68DRAFT_131810 [Plectosphaerella plurivora]